jgi:hypothetical protein
MTEYCVRIYIYTYEPRKTFWRPRILDLDRNEYLCLETILCEYDPRFFFTLLLFIYGSGMQQSPLLLKRFIDLV